jgi:hypothetical protein
MRIEELKAGPELDALITTNVMGRTICDHSRQGISTAQSGGYAMCGKQDCKGELHYDYLPKYSTDIATAFEIIEKLGGGYEICGNRGSVYVGFGRAEDYHPNSKGHANAETLPLAVCRASLLAVERTS